MNCSLKVIIATLVLGSAAPAAAVSASEAQAPPPPSNSTESSAGYYHPIDPIRLMDSRDDHGASGPFTAGETVSLRVAGVNGVPADASAVVLNVTVTAPSRNGYITVFPTGGERPTASNLSFHPGQTVPNLVVAKVGKDGQVSFFNSHGSSHLVVDAMGWYDDLISSFPDIPEGGSRQQSLAPVRLLDTRDVGRPIGPGEARKVLVAGIGKIPADATAVALNITVTQPTAAGNLRLYPTGSPRPNVSNLNFLAGETIPNLVIAKVGDDGHVTILNSHGSTHVIVDANAFFEPVDQPFAGGELNVLPPTRLLDTRTANGAPVGAGGSVDVQVVDRGGVPESNVDSVVLNLTVTEPTAHGFVTVHPSNTARPTASNSNFVPGSTSASLVVARVGPNGKIRIFNSDGSTHVIVDIMGWYNSAESVAGPPEAPFRPTESSDDGPTAASTSQAEPGFAEQQAEFWKDNDPQDILRQASPEPLIDRDGSGTNDRLTEYSAGERAPFQIWSEGYTYPGYSNQIGRLVYWIPAERRWSYCTATMVARNLAITAAHCVVKGSATFTNFAFFAGLEGRTAHGGIYTNVVDTIYPAVTSDGARVPAFETDKYGYSADWALVQFGPQGGVYPGDRVGSFGLKLRPNLNWLLSYGYPGEGSYFSRYCTERPTRQDEASCYLYKTWGRYGGYQHYTADWYEIGWGSNMSGGASGGPVFTYEAGEYRVASVNSNGQVEVCDSWTAAGTCERRRHVLNMWGPYFTQVLADAYQQFGI